MYLVSPELFVTSEHIISARASSSLSCPSRLLGSGVVGPLLGLGKAACAVAVVAVEVADGGPMDALLPFRVLGLVVGVVAPPALSANRLSNVARSVLPSSSSGRTPDRRINDSMRARRFSRPSIYLALCLVSSNPACTHTCTTRVSVPFGRLPLLLDLGEDAFCLVVQAVGT